MSTSPTSSAHAPADPRPGPGPLLPLLRRLVLAARRVDLAFTRRVQALRGAPRFELEGECLRCGRCCEQPAIEVGALFFHSSLLRRLLLSWLERVQGLRFVGAVRRPRLLLFECRHYDRERARCRDYPGRPLMCRDYPRPLLDAANPEFFPECGFRARLVGAEAMRRALEGTALDPSERQRLAARLRLD